MDFPEIAELDLNPLLAFPDAAVAVDARVMLGAWARLTAHRGGAHIGFPLLHRLARRSVLLMIGATHHAIRSAMPSARRAS